MDPSFLSILPNLSIGVISVLSLAYISLKHAEAQKTNQDVFIKTLDSRADKYERSLQDRETAMRSLEVSVRNSMTEQLTKNTVELINVAKILARVGRHLDGEK